MSAQVLREAAALMRERAERTEDLRPGPWVVAPDGVAVGIWSEPKARLAADSDYESVAEHIASWPGDVALAVADLLEDGATYLDYVAAHHANDATGEEARYYLAVANAYLASPPH